jgi:hypothetical protein
MNVPGAIHLYEFGGAGVPGEAVLHPIHGVRGGARSKRGRLSIALAILGPFGDKQILRLKNSSRPVCFVLYSEEALANFPDCQ